MVIYSKAAFQINIFGLVIDFKNREIHNHYEFSDGILLISISYNYITEKLRKVVLIHTLVRG